MVKYVISSNRGFVHNVDFIDYYVYFNSYYNIWGARFFNLREARGLIKNLPEDIKIKYTIEIYND